MSDDREDQELERRRRLREMLSDMPSRGDLSQLSSFETVEVTVFDRHKQFSDEEYKSVEDEITLSCKNKHMTHLAMIKVLRDITASDVLRKH